jgi:DNA segregation ATPase FtsK/SpoIIIE, S-DNA-T family
VAEPLIVLLIDELAALTAWINDRTIKKRIETALGLLLSQGRAPGVVIVGAVQEARKDIVPQRGLLPVRVGMRMNEAEEVHLFMGQGARNRGATCDLIPDTLPGVAYVAIDGIAEPIRGPVKNQLVSVVVSLAVRNVRSAAGVANRLPAGAAV